MKRIWKASLVLAGASVLLQLGQCARWLGDVAGDTLWLRGID